MPTKKPFASTTTVSVDKSVQELKKLLEKYKIEEYLHYQKSNQTIIMFKLRGRGFQFKVPMPDPDAKQFIYKTAYTKRSIEDQKRLYEQELMRRWRVMIAVIKARLIAIDEGLSTFEEEFLKETLLPDGRTVGEWVNAEYIEAQLTGKLPNIPLFLPQT